MIRSVFLHGALGEMYGPGPHRMYARDFRDLHSGLRSRHPTFERQLRQFPNVGLVKVDPATDRVAYVEPDELAMGFGGYPELHLAAGEAGAFIAAPVAGVGLVIGGTAVATGAAAWAAWAVINIAIGVAMNAIMSSLQETPKSEEDKKPDNTSTLFSAPSNRTNQGARVQLVFGTFLADSVTLSQQVTARRQAVSAKDAITVVEGESARLNVFANNSGLVDPAALDFSANGGAWVPAGTVLNGPLVNAITGQVYVPGDFAGFGPNSDGHYEFTYGDVPAYTLLLQADGTLVLSTVKTVPTNARTLQVVVRYETGPAGARTTEQEEVRISVSTFIPEQRYDPDGQ